MAYEKELDQYLDLKESYWARTTLKSVRAKLHTCLNAAPLFEPESLFEYLKGKDYGLYTIQTYFLICSRFEEEMLRRQAFASFLKKNRSLFRNAYQEKTLRMKTEEYLSYLKQAPSDDIFNLLILLGRLGLRKLEAFNAKWTDISDGYLVVVGKGGKIRKVPVLESWFRGDHSFPYIAGRNRRRRAFFESLPYSYHDFRSYYATTVANHQDLGLKDAQLLLGHSSIVTTQKYVRADLENAKRVLTGVK